MTFWIRNGSQARRKEGELPKFGERDSIPETVLVFTNISCLRTLPPNTDVFSQRL